MSKKVIVIDPGHGGDPKDLFRLAPTGETEAQINLRVAKQLLNLLKNKYEVWITRDSDFDLSLRERAQLAIKKNADLLISIHHNSANPVNPNLNYPLVFAPGNLNTQNAHLLMAKMLLSEFEEFHQSSGLIVSDRVLFDQGLGLFRESGYKMTVTLGEFSFFSNPKEAEKLSRPEYNLAEAQCYQRAIEKFFAVGPKNYHIEEIVGLFTEPTLSKNSVEEIFQQLSDDNLISKSLEILQAMRTAPHPLIFTLRDRLKKEPSHLEIQKIINFIDQSFLQNT